MREVIQFKLNNQPVKLEANGSDNLLWIIRYALQLTGTKYGCGSGDCGSCTILVDGEPVRACLTYMDDIRGKDITTIEGLAKGDDLHPVQQSFVDHDAMQCGFCTPGMIMNATGLFNSNPRPSRKEIIEAMDTNLCRCGSYGRILSAIEEASKKTDRNN